MPPTMRVFSGQTVNETLGVFTKMDSLSTKMDRWVFTKMDIQQLIKDQGKQVIRSRQIDINRKARLMLP